MTHENLVLNPDVLPVHSLKGYSNGQPDYGERLGLFNPAISQIVLMPQGAWADLEAKSGDQLEHLIACGLLVPEGHSAPKTEGKPLTSVDAYINVTDVCNLGCPGCATKVDVRMAAGERQNTMTLSTARQTVDRLFRSANEKGMTEIQLTWAGGEITVSNRAEALVHDIQPYLEEMQQIYPLIHTRQVLITNGTRITSERAVFYKERGIHLAISLWGMGDVHNRERRVKDIERDGYDATIQGIQTAIEAGTSCNLLFVLKEANAHQCAELFDAVWNTKGTNFIGKDWQAPMLPIPMAIQFFRPQSMVRNSEKTIRAYATMLTGLQGGFDAMRLMIADDVPLRPFRKIDYLQLIGNNGTFIQTPTPCGSGFNYMGIGPDGSAVSCHQLLYGLTPNTARMDEGANIIDVANSRYAGRQEKLLGTAIQFSDTIPQAILPILRMCGGGGCPLMSQAEHGGELGHAASTAEFLYAPIIPQMLALEAERQLVALANGWEDPKEAGLLTC